MWEDMAGAIVRDLIAIGIVIGLGIAGLLWFLVWLWSHVTIGWV